MSSCLPVTQLTCFLMNCTPFLFNCFLCVLVASMGDSIRLGCGHAWSNCGVCSHNDVRQAFPTVNLNQTMTPDLVCCFVGNSIRQPNRCAVACSDLKLDSWTVHYLEHMRPQSQGMTHTMSSHDTRSNSANQTHKPGPCFAPGLRMAAVHSNQSQLHTFLF